MGSGAMLVVAAALPPPPARLLLGEAIAAAACASCAARCALAACSPACRRCAAPTRCRESPGLMSAALRATRCFLGVILAPREAVRSWSTRAETVFAMRTRARQGVAPEKQPHDTITGLYRAGLVVGRNEMLARVCARGVFPAELLSCVCLHRTPLACAAIAAAQPLPPNSTVLHMFEPYTSVSSCASSRHAAAGVLLRRALEYICMQAMAVGCALRSHMLILHTC